MKYKKKNIFGLCRAVTFSLVFVLIFVGLSNVFVPKGKNDATGMSANITDAYKFEDKNSIDVAFIGNSDVYRAVNPIKIWEDCQITSCDIGMPRMSVRESYTRLKNFFEVQSPSMIVLETDCFFSTINEFDAQGNLIENHIQTAGDKINDGLYNLRTTFTDLDNAILSGISYYYPLTKYKYRWKEIRLSDFTNKKGKYQYVAKGFIYSSKKVPFDYGDTYMGVDDGSTEEFDRYAQEYCDKIIQLCQENNCQFMLITVPSGTSWNYRKHNAIENYATENGISYYDFNTDTKFMSKFNWKRDTKDGGNHLNTRGAKKVTASLEKILVNSCGISASSLTAEQADAWNTDVEKYYSEIAKKKSK